MEGILFFPVGVAPRKSAIYFTVSPLTLRKFVGLLQPAHQLIVNLPFPGYQHMMRPTVGVRFHRHSHAGRFQPVGKPNGHNDTVIDRVTVYEDGRLVFRFKNGTEITETL